MACLRKDRDLNKLLFTATNLGRSEADFAIKLAIMGIHRAWFNCNVPSCFEIERNPRKDNYFEEKRSDFGRLVVFVLTAL